jgi:hypothetical protein
MEFDALFRTSYGRWEGLGLEEAEVETEAAVGTVVAATRR